MTELNNGITGGQVTKLPKSPSKSVKWPEPLKYFYSKKGYPDNCVEAANRMLEACKKAYEETR